MYNHVNEIYEFVVKKSAKETEKELLDCNQALNDIKAKVFAKLSCTEREKLELLITLHNDAENIVKKLQIRIIAN